jgi:hypothetical protein
MYAGVTVAGVQSFSMLQQPSAPVVVRILEEPARETTVVDVLIGAIGLTGVLVVIAVICGAALGGLFVLYRKIQARRRPYTPEPGEDVPRIV